MRRQMMRLSVLSLAGMLLAGSLSQAGSWARFRGPNGKGEVTDKQVPTQWSDKENTVWKTEIPGVGHSSPIVWENRIFMQSADPKGDKRWLICVDTGSGKILWQKDIPASKGKTHRLNSMASSTPTTDGERIYTAFWDGKRIAMYAFDFDGKLLWERDMGTFASQHGHGGSPIVYDGLVYFNNDQDGTASLVALDAKTGKPAWKVTRPPFRACYSVPFLWENPVGKTELVVGSTAGISSYDPKSGDEIWTYQWKNFQKSPLRTVASPVFSDGIVYHTSGDGAGDRHFIAVKLGGKGNVTDSALVWENPEPRLFPYVPTLLTHGSHLFSVNDDGFAGCYDAKTGKQVWRVQLGKRGNKVLASPVLINDNIYAIDVTGNTYVFKAAPEFKLVATNALGEDVSASPAVADGHLYIRSHKHLFCIGKPGAE